VKTSRALVTNAGTPEGRAAVEALLGMCGTVFVAGEGPLPEEGKIPANHSCANEAVWQAMMAEITGDSPLDVLIHCPVSGSGMETAQTQLRENWLAAKFANVGLSADEGVFISILRDGVESGDADMAAVCEGMVISTRAAQIDAAREGKRLRSNRLIASPDCDAGDLREAISALAGPAGSFMAGADLRLSASAGGACSTSLEGRSFIVTGATSGIGRATAIEIGRRGGWVGVAGRKPDLGEETLAAVREAGGDGMFIRLDVTDPQAWNSAVDQVVEQTGALHGLVNNAGEAKNAPISQLSEDVIRFLVDLNYGGCRRGMTAAIEALGKSGGAVVNVSSVAGIRAGPGGSAYGASKAAMIGLSQMFHQTEAAPRGARVNVIEPGLIWSDSVADALGEEGAQAFREMVVANTPLGRVGLPEEVGRFVAYLLSPAASGIGGQSIPVSGGLELLHP